MKVLKWILIVFLSLIALFLIYNATQDNKIEVEESIVIDAPAGLIYDQLTDYTTWDKWSVWNMKDSNMKVTFSGDMGTVGYKIEWKSSHPEVGNGSQEIVEIRSNEYIKTAMQFEGMNMINHAEFILSAEETGTKLTWTYLGAETPFYLNFMNSLFKPMIVANYKAGLKNLKALVEEMPMEVENPMNLEILEVEPIEIISILDSTDAAGISTKLAELYTELAIFTEMNEKVNMAGSPLAIYHFYSPEKVILEAGFPIAGEANPSGRIKAKSTPSGKVIKGTHYGNYDASGNMHNAIETYAKESGLTFAGSCWEVYANDPEKVDSAEVETVIFYPIQ